MPRARTVRRVVRSDDPTLTPEANRLLTGELRAAVGSDEVELPAGRADHREAERGGRSRLLGTLVANRVLVALSLAIAAVLGVILSLATGSWWLFFAACAAHAVGTLTVAAFSIGLTTQVEHVDPAVAARLEAEGVPDPDRVLTELASEFAGADEPARGAAAEVVTTGDNDNRADPETEPARRTHEQRTVMTPSARRSSPAGHGSPIGLMPVAVVAGVLLIALIAAIAEGSWMWLGAAVVWLGGGVWLWLVTHVDGPAEERAAREGEPLRGGRHRPVPR